MSLRSPQFPRARPAPPAEDQLAHPGHPGWSVDAHTGCWIWNPNPQPDEMVTWSGRCYARGPAVGFGVLEWRHADKVSRYEGEYRDGKPHGRGSYTASDGNRYEGEYRDGRRYGRGVFTFANGGRYEGEYRDGKPNGLGTLSRDGATYSGTWIDGCFRHAGRWAYANTPAEACGFVLAPPVSSAPRQQRGGIQGAATRGCDYFNATVVMELGIHASGRTTMRWMPSRAHPRTRRSPPT